ncbi:LamB/YcsF family protein [Pseudomonas sp. LB-090624]|uniref:LamB/YcsF family protein n=1 Tax=Pseudomonas sp. LB-090624 TaxID=2213079 RepID=UPI000D89CBF5|nr:5-oxoprolinase subunit PxpA [Pseudomonas sp. LB-090624]PYB78856.1 LamB/YcsF family protein [Pseudomonas sp. LB-090624]
MMIKTVDINCDMGEGFGPYTIAQDDEMLDIATSANMACGFHAGDFTIMADICTQAKARGVAVGAHPGYPDLWGFGRRQQSFSKSEIKQMLAYQIGAAWAIAKSVGHTLTFVKAHGALGHLVADNEVAASALIETIQEVNDELILSVMAGVTLEQMAVAAGLNIAREIYADRAYQDNGRLVPRGQPGAVIHDGERAANRVLAMVQEGAIITESGKRIPVDIDTICVHGDTHGAVAMARTLRKTLESSGIQIAPYSQCLASV